MSDALIFWIDSEEFCLIKSGKDQEWFYEYLRDWHGDSCIFVEWL